MNNNFEEINDGFYTKNQINTTTDDISYDEAFPEKDKSRAAKRKNDYTQAKRRKETFSHIKDLTADKGLHSFSKNGLHEKVPSNNKNIQSHSDAMREESCNQAEREDI